MQSPFTKVAFVDFVEDNSSMKVRLFAQSSLSGLMLLASAVARPADAAGLPLSTITSQGVLVLATDSIGVDPTNSTIYTVNADGTDMTTISGPGNLMPSWTPDGRIIYVSGQSGQPEIWLMNGDGSDAHEVGNLTGVDALQPEMARNGLIAFQASSGTSSSIMTMKSDGSDLTTVPLPSGMNPVAVSLAPSGDWIVFTNQTESPYNRELWRVNIDGTGLQELTFPTNPDYPDANAPSISPDGTTIAFFYGKAADEGSAGVTQSVFTFGERNLATMSATGGPITILTKCTPVTTEAQLDALTSSDCIAADNPSWSPDGGWIAYIRAVPGIAGGTWLISADGQDTQLLLADGSATEHVPLELAWLQVTGTLDLGGATQTEAGGVMLSGGTIQNGTLASNITFSLQAGTVSAVLAGTGVLIKTTDDTVTLTGANTYSGGTYVQDGTLALSGAGTLGATTGLLNVSGGTLDLGGTTQTQDGGVTLSGGTIQNGTLVSSDTFALQDGTVSAVLAGVGALIKSTDDTVTLTGVNTYTGGTYVQDGTLALSGAGTLGATTGLLNVSGGTLDLGGTTQTQDGGLMLSGGTIQNGTLVLSSTFDLQDGTVSAVLAGAGVLIKTTDDTVMLTGANTYSGGTYVQDGTLALSGIGTLGATTGLLNVSGGTLDLGGTTQTQNGGVTLSGGTIQNGTLVSSSTFDLQDGTVSAVLAGAGVLIKSTDDTVTLTGANTYSGGTYVQDGTLALSGAGKLGATTGSLNVSGGTLDLGGTTQTQDGGVTLSGGTIRGGILVSSGTFALQGGTIDAVLAGSGAAVKSTDDTVTLTAGNTYTGSTTVDAGTLSVNGSITSSSGLTVNAGAIVDGTGTLPSTTIASGGTLAPGNSIGTISVNGTLSFRAGSSYAVEVSPNNTDRTNVTATASLSGTVDAAFASGNYPVRSYTILSAIGGLNGTSFDALATSNLPSNFGASLSYTATDVLLNLRAALGVNVSLADNQQNVADAIDGFFNNGGTLPPRLAALYDRSGEQLTTALSQLSGEAATDAEVGAFALTDQFLRLMLDPFVDGRSGSDWPTGGFGQALGFAPEAPASPPPNSALGYAGMLKAPPKAIFEQRWSAWGSSFGGSTTTSGDATVGSNSVTASDYGYAGGMDYHFSPDAIAGFALGGGGTSWGLAQALGGGRSDAFQAGVYTKTNFGPAYVAAALSFANHWMNTNRIALGDQLQASFRGQSYAGRIEAGYRYATLYDIGVTPYLALQSQSFHTPDYSETDATGGSLALSYNASNATDTRSELGVCLDELKTLSAMPLLLQARIAWEHDWVSDPALIAAFQALPATSFLVNGAAARKNSALASAGAELHLNKSWSLAVKFDSDFAVGAQTYAGTGTLRHSW